jgi:L-lactate dehydrogenase
MFDGALDPDALLAFATAVLERAGLPAEPAAIVATGLLEADLLGHDTHGLALLADYVEELDNGTMTKDGAPAVITDHAAVQVWDGRRLPGVYTTALAVDAAVGRAARFGLGAVAVRRSHHIACLATFVEAAARGGTMVLVFSSDPSDAHVAPFGGTVPVMTPNPVAAGIPARPDPIVLDVSTSITTAAMCGRTRANGKRLRGAWLLDRDGRPTDDPGVMQQGGSILPIGGIDHGHKGYALSLLVEALTQGLGGFGRAEAPKEWGAAVLVLAFSPALFAGTENFLREVDWLAAACHASTPASDGVPVRLPGEAGFARKAHARAQGLRLAPSIPPKLATLAARFGLAAPRPFFAAGQEEGALP